MKTLLSILLLLASFVVNAAVCHSTPTSDDRLFYDRAIVSAVTNLSWDGYNANVIARGMIDHRRAAFATLEGIPASGPLTDEEAALYDALVVATVQHATENTAGGMAWIDGVLAGQWAHGVAWVAMYYRMQMRC